MNFIKKYIFVLISLLVLIACSKKEEPNNIEYISTKSIPVSLGINDSDTRSMTYSGTKVSFPKTDLTIQVATRVGAEVVSQTLVFSYKNGKHSYEGQLKVPAAGLSPSNTISNVEIAAVLLQGGNKTYATASANTVTIQKPTEAVIGTDTDAVVTLPSYSEWATLPYANTGANKTFKKTTLLFRSAGTLIGLKIKNEDTAEHTVGKIKINSTSVSSTWRFSFGTSNMSNSITDVVSDAIYNIPNNGVTIQAGQTTNDTYYIWMAPKSGATSTTEFTAVLSDGNEMKAYTAKNPIRLSSRVTATLVLKSNPADNFPGGTTPWDTNIPGVAIGEDGNGNITTTINDPVLQESNYYDLKQTQNIAMRILGKAQADGLEYYLPTKEQWARFTPTFSSRDHTVSHTSEEVVVFSDRQPADVSGDEYKYTSIYKYSDNTRNNLYGIRFIHPTQKTATAFKYEVIKEYNQSGDLVKGKIAIKMVYIGDPNKYTIDDIMSSNFDWSSAKIVNIPLLGYKNYSNLINEVGYSAYHWSSTVDGQGIGAETSQYFPQIGSYGFFNVNRGNSLPLFLFGREIK